MTAFPRICQHSFGVVPGKRRFTSMQVRAARCRPLQLDTSGFTRNHLARPDFYLTRQTL
jgi:hypothetical protein